MNYDFSFMAPDSLLASFTALLAIILTALAWKDIKHLILPDYLTGILALAGLGQALFWGGLPLLDAALGALFGTALLAVVATGFHKLRGYEGLGLGDIKLTGAAGCWVGWQAMPQLLLLASMTALAFVAARFYRKGKWDRKRRIPFGPFLCAGTFLTWLTLIFASSA